MKCLSILRNCKNHEIFMDRNILQIKSFPTSNNKPIVLARYNLIFNPKPPWKAQDRVYLKISCSQSAYGPNSQDFHVLQYVWETQMRLLDGLMISGHRMQTIRTESEFYFSFF